MPFKIPRTFRSLKRLLCTWIQFILVIGIVGVLFDFHANRLLSGVHNLKSHRDTSAPCVRSLENKRSSSMSYLIFPCDSRVGGEADYGINENAKKNNSQSKYNETENRNIEPEESINKTMASDVDQEINAIIKEYESVVEVHKTSNDYYSEVAPAYGELLTVVMDTRDQCKDASEYNAIIAVHSATNHFENRAAFRWLYGDFAKTTPYRFKLVFFIGLVKNSTLQESLKKENEAYGDTVQGNFVDAYVNMTYKAIMVFNWLETHCQGIRALFRVDDDVFINIQRVHPRWSYIQRRSGSTKGILCNRLLGDKVMRTGKWAVPESLISGDRYDFMRCPGYFAAITVDLIHDMNVQAQKTKFFWIDDIIMLGLVPNVIGGVTFHPFNKWMAGATMSDDFYNCIKQLGPRCSYWVGITDVKNFKTLYGYLTGSIPTVG